jgi:hypothetical protein
MNKYNYTDQSIRLIAIHITPIEMSLEYFLKACPQKK